MNELPSGNMPFHILFPHIGLAETRFLDAQISGRRRDQYVLFEYYCVDPFCDCRQVVVRVCSRRIKGQPVATIFHRFDDPAPEDLAPERTALDPLNAQSSIAEEILAVFRDGLPLDDYAARLVRHYEMVKYAVADSENPIHKVIRQAQFASWRGPGTGPSAATRQRLRMKRKGR